MRNEARQILEVTEDKDEASSYQFQLSDFPRKDILGLSIGSRQIYISYELGRRPLNDRHYLWLLRQTLAHEIAHEIAGHANQKRDTSFNRSAADGGVTGKDIGLPWYVRLRPYAPRKELEADLKGMKYWEKLHWDCRIWVRIFDALSKQNYSGGFYWGRCR